MMDNNYCTLANVQNLSLALSQLNRVNMKSFEVQYAHIINAEDITFSY